MAILTVGVRPAFVQRSWADGRWCAAGFYAQEQLLIHCSLDKMLSNAAVISAEVTTDQHLAAKATLSLSFGAGR